MQSGFCVTRFFEGGDWHDAANWANDMMPGPNDDVSMMGDGIIKQSVNVNNIGIFEHKLTIQESQMPGGIPVVVNARYIFTTDDGEIINDAELILSKGEGTLLVRGNLINSGTITFDDDFVISGTGSNMGGTITGTETSQLFVAFDGIFNNHGIIDGPISNIQLSGTGVFNNYSPIQLDPLYEGDFVLINNAHFTNYNVLSGNMKIRIDDDSVFENRNQVDLIHTGGVQFVRLIENAQFKNFGNIRLDQQNGFSIGLTHQDDAQFENHGLFIMENAKFSITPDTTGSAYFRNEAGAQLYISNTAADGIRFGISRSGQFQNAGLISLCQTNQTSGTCPILAQTGSIIQNLSSGELFTGVDIFTSNCNTAIQNSIINSGLILPACADDPNFNCPLNYTGVSTLTGTINGPQDFEAHVNIESLDAFIDIGTVTFDAGNSITLIANFEVNSNTVFEAIIDGCGGI